MLPRLPQSTAPEVARASQPACSRPVPSPSASQAPAGHPWPRVCKTLQLGAYHCLAIGVLLCEMQLMRGSLVWGRSDEEPCGSGSAASEGEPEDHPSLPRRGPHASPASAPGRGGSGPGSGTARPAAGPRARASVGLRAGDALARKSGGAQGVGQGRAGRGSSSGKAGRGAAGGQGRAAAGGALAPKRALGTFSRLAQPRASGQAAGQAALGRGRKQKGAPFGRFAQARQFC